MNDKARVYKIEESTVYLVRPTTGGCATKNLFGKKKISAYPAKNPDNLELAPGDGVEVFLAPGRTIAAGFMVFMMPLLTLLAGLAGVPRIWPEAGQVSQILGGAFGLVLGFFMAWGYSKLTGKTGHPRIIRKLPLSELAPCANGSCSGCTGA